MNLRNVDESWSYLEQKYPIEIQRMFKRITKTLEPWLTNSALFVVGSYATGLARFSWRNGHIDLFSDIDLLIIAENDNREPLHNQKYLTNQLSLISRELGLNNKGFHIGLRFRFIREISEFDFKCKTLGYNFKDQSILLYSELSSSKNIILKEFQYDNGLLCENICSKIWTIIRYITPPLTAGEEYYNRNVVFNALKCIESAIRFSNNPLFEEQNLYTFDPLDDVFMILEKTIIKYSEFVTYLSIADKDLCLASTVYNEFDFFKISKNNPSLLPKILFMLLEMLIVNNNSPRLSKLCGEMSEIFIEISGGLEFDLHNTDPLYLYRFIRYHIAERRIKESELFRRDRGYNFLNELSV